MTDAELSRDLQNDLGWLDRPGYGPEDATKTAAIIACRRALAAEAEIERLREALRPFASQAARGPIFADCEKVEVRLEDCRRAAELLEGKP